MKGNMMRMRRTMRVWSGWCGEGRLTEMLCLKAGSEEEFYICRISLAVDPLLLLLEFE